MTTAHPRPGGRLDRMMRPASVAIVGASERQSRSNNAVEAMAGGGVRLYYVNPNRSEAYGEATFEDLSAIPEAVDAVLSLVPSEATVDVVAEAQKVGVGGVVTIAGGFSEDGPEGAALERELLRAADGMPVLGPNCNGFVRPSSGARLSGAPVFPFPGGHVGVVTHSGALLSAFGLAAVERCVGFSSLISTGNEMDIDMAECLEFLAEDDQTRCVALVVESVRDPDRFFAAVRHLTERGKPVVALKLGRSARGSEIATSHTGALAGEAWIYDAAFRQHGISLARDLADLMDRVALLAQLPPERWTAVRGLAVASLSGGWAALTSDICAEEGVELPRLGELADRINTVLPERSTINPLDMTGFAMGRAEVVESVLDTFAESSDVDVLMLQWSLDEAAAASSATFVEAARRVTNTQGKPVILCSIEDGHPGEWAHQLAAEGIAVGRGLRATARGLRTMADHLTFRERRAAPEVPSTVRPIVPPRGLAVDSSAGKMLTFGATMDLLAASGIPVAPFEVIDANAPVPDGLGFDGPYVVKLADVPHRSDIGAIRLGIGPEGIAAAVEDLRALARHGGLPGAVVVQPQLAIHGEAFVGVQGRTGLGPLVAFGVGGIFVELLGRVSGRLAPLAPVDAQDMLDEMADTGVFEGARGQRTWDRAELAGLLRSVGALAAGAQDWLLSLDINPLALTDGGFCALDGLCLVGDGFEDNS